MTFRLFSSFAMINVAVVNISLYAFANTRYTPACGTVGLFVFLLQQLLLNCSPKGSCQMNF